MRVQAGDMSSLFDELVLHQKRQCWKSSTSRMLANKGRANQRKRQKQLLLLSELIFTTPNTAKLGMQL